jgi:epsilon-lactone hydrolase
MAHAGIEMIAGFITESGVMQGSILERREAMAASAAGAPAPDGVDVESTTVGGRPAEWLVPGGATRDRVVLYLHGGGYCIGSLDTHRGLAGAIALASGLAVLSLDYRLAPEHPFPAALDDAGSAYTELLGADRAPEDLAIAGDSAGGGLTVATLLALRDAGVPLPAAAACLSPWVDLTQTSPSCNDADVVDPLLNAADLQLLADAYLDGQDPRLPLASPRFAPDLAGLPPLIVEVGEDEPLLDDAVALAGRVGVTGSDVVLNVWPEMIHVFQAFPPEIVPEAGESLRGVGEFLRNHVGRGRSST